MATEPRKLPALVAVKIASAAAAVGTTRNTVHVHLRKDAKFRRAFNKLAPNRVSFYEDCAAKFSAKGNPALIIFMLKKLNPKKYGDASEAIREIKKLLVDIKDSSIVTGSDIQPVRDRLPEPDAHHVGPEIKSAGSEPS